MKRRVCTATTRKPFSLEPRGEAPDVGPAVRGELQPAVEGQRPTRHREGVADDRESKLGGAREQRRPVVPDEASRALRPRHVRRPGDEHEDRAVLLVPVLPDPLAHLEESVRRLVHEALLVLEDGAGRVTREHREHPVEGGLVRVAEGRDDVEVDLAVELFFDVVPGIADEMPQQRLRDADVRVLVVVAKGFPVELSEGA